MDMETPGKLWALLESRKSSIEQSLLAWLAAGPEPHGAHS